MTDLRALVPRPLWKLGGATYRRFAAAFATPERSKWLPLDSRVFGPPRYWSHTPEYCREHGGEWHEVVPAGVAERQMPHCVNYPAAEMLNMVATVLPAAGVARLPNARKVGSSQRGTHISLIIVGMDMQWGHARFISAMGSSRLRVCLV